MASSDAEHDNEHNSAEHTTDAIPQDVEPGHRVIDSQELLLGKREVWIRHGSEMYRLRRTSSGGLYLSK